MRNKVLLLVRKPLVIWQHGITYAGLMSFAPAGSVGFFNTCPLTDLKKDHAVGDSETALI